MRHSSRKLLADTQAQFVPLGARAGRKSKNSETVGHDVGDVAGAAAHRVAAVEPLAEGEIAGASGALSARLRRRPLRITEAMTLELRQREPEIAAEEARPGAAGEHDAARRRSARVSVTTPLNAPGFRFDAAHGAMRDDLGALPRRLGDGRGPFAVRRGRRSACRARPASVRRARQDRSISSGRSDWNRS